MVSVPTVVPSPSELKKEGGKWLRSLRDRRGLSQKELAALVDVQNSVFISQLENGRVRIPPERYDLWAKAYGISTYDFVKTLMSFYDPLTYRLLFQREVESNDWTGSSPNVRTAVPTSHVSDRYLDALYMLLGKKTAELEMLKEKLCSTGSGELKRF